MLETPEDARQIHAACVGSNVVLVGTSFVGTVFQVGIFLRLSTLMVCSEVKKDQDPFLLLPMN